ncbi:metallophosphoesterase [Parabacteroides sp. 52]|uniref:metallophosphoesterase family protein n=1 Tax=unclassified Parabacteroides TaxID=2649774 RepID=UPI0013D7AEDA|nr:MULTISPECIES: metallophosphoesterase [unclassified Parabacteroides]MDH6533950.1 Icc-related predicted phosphoesterase [Parabacteroides sp. PM5-20]NDV54694.1 metallophosphoesterase [Parabacteroides sp. 52]
MYKKILSFSVFLLFVSCDLFDYHPYDGKIDFGLGKDENIRNIPLIESACHRKDTIRFVWFGDSGRSLDELELFVKHINQKDSIDFGIHAGDLVEFGTTKEYEWGQEILSKLHFPYVVIIGNHDIIANGDKIYEKMFGPQNFSFIAQDILFLCLNTNAIEYDYSNPIPDFSFIKETLEYGDVNSEYPRFRRTVVAMHAPPQNEQFNNNVADIFQEKIKEFPALQFCLHGHTHNYKGPIYFFEDEIPYYCCDNMGKRSYLLFTITPDSYTHERIYF